MKIAIAINTSWNIYNFRRGLIDTFLADGHEIIAIAPRDDYSSRLEEIGCRFIPLEMSASGMNPIKDLMLLWHFWRVLKSVKPDVLLTYTIKPNIYGSYAGGRLDIPVIANVSGLGTVFLWKGYVKSIARTLYRWGIRHAAWVFFQNPEDKEAFLKEIPLDRERLSVIPGSGVNLSKFVQAPLPGGQRLQVLMIGRLLVEKGVYEYIGAIRRILERGLKIDFHLLGPLDTSHKRAVSADDLEEWCKAGLVKYTQHSDDVAAYISQSDVVVLPSYREGTPKTLLEAGAMGRVLIATDVPGCRQVVHHGYNGLLCEVKNVDALAEAILKVNELSVSERQQWGDNSAQYIAENYDEQIIIRQYQSKIEELVPFIGV